MRALLLLLLAGAPASAGVWTRVSPAAMRFEGDIEEGEYGRFAAVFSPAVRELTVTSPGGVTEEGILIGLVLAATGVKVIVVGECLSSCANYLFVAGHQREIRGGIVGYHGNVRACFGSPAQREEGRRRLEESARRHGLKEEEIRDSIERNDRRLDRELEDEARLLRVMGVSQELFDRSCTKDKGAGDGGTYAFLLPRRATFERYGLWGIVGEQDPAVMAAARFTYLHD